MRNRGKQTMPRLLPELKYGHGEDFVDDVRRHDIQAFGIAREIIDAVGQGDKNLIVRERERNDIALVISRLADESQRQRTALLGIKPTPFARRA